MQPTGPRAETVIRINLQKRLRESPRVKVLQTECASSSGRSHFYYRRHKHNDGCESTGIDIQCGVIVHKLKPAQNICLKICLQLFAVNCLSVSKIFTG